MKNSFKLASFIFTLELILIIISANYFSSYNNLIIINFLMLIVSLLFLIPDKKTGCWFKTLWNIKNVRKITIVFAYLTNIIAVSWFFYNRLTSFDVPFEYYDKFVVFLFSQYIVFAIIITISSILFLYLLQKYVNQIPFSLHNNIRMLLIFGICFLITFVLFLIAVNRDLSQIFEFYQYILSLFIIDAIICSGVTLVEAHLLRK